MTRRVRFSLVALAVLWLANQWWIAREAKPLYHLRRGLSEFGLQPNAFELRGYDSSFGLIGRHVEAIYVPTNGSGPPVRVMAVRRLAFRNWQIVGLSMVD